METTIDKTKKYPCPQCNAELAFDAAQGLMICSFCGYKAPVEEAGSMTEVHTETQIDEAAVEEIEEHNLTEWLDRLSKAEGAGWGTETKTFKCRSCNAAVAVDPGVTATVCPFCGSHHVIAQEESAKLIQPESLIPFQIDQKTAIAKFRTWLGKGWFRPNEVKRIANNADARVQGVYLPFWTFDAQTFSRWNAEAGYYYYVTERYTVTVNGRRETRTRQVRKVRWQPASGTHNEFFDDVLVYATRSVQERILQRIYPFDTKQLVPYRPQYLAGWRAEEYQIDLAEGWKMGQAIIDDRLRTACGSEVPGDTHRNLRVQTQFSNLTFKHVLLPVWIASYRFNNKVYNFMVNGKTGQVHGEAPISWWKVVLTVLIVLVLLACILIAMSLLGGLTGEEVSMIQHLSQWTAMIITLRSLI
ncbi:MAG: zinc ribbon domain-containing protein [Anaerolineae bacterium]|nr:zinc ribbon domain-containing protein [Anaerolineae bacterium]